LLGRASRASRTGLLYARMRASSILSSGMSVTPVSRTSSTTALLEDDMLDGGEFSALVRRSLRRSRVLLDVVWTSLAGVAIVCCGSPTSKSCARGTEIYTFFERFVDIFIDHVKWTVFGYPRTLTLITFTTRLLPCIDVSSAFVDVGFVRRTRLNVHAGIRKPTKTAPSVVCNFSSNKTFIVREHQPASMDTFVHGSIQR